MEASEGESRRQAALLRHPPGTLVLWRTAVLLNRHCFAIKTLLQSSTSERVYPPTACEQVYSESVIPRIAKAASGVTGTPYNELMNSWGVYFLGFVGKYGYDRILKVKERKAMTETVDAHFLYLCVGKCIFFFFFSLFWLILSVFGHFASDAALV